MASSLEVQVLGCGDAFGSGGVPNTSFHLRTPDHRLLLDCGASTLPQLKKYGLSSDDVDGIVISHFHGDHYGGIPFLLLEMALVHQRERPLYIYGPPGLEGKLKTLQEALYPGTSEHMDKLDLRFTSFRDRSTIDVGEFLLKTRPVQHATGSHPHAVRIETHGKVIAFSGDTGWTDELYPIAEGADLFICECNFFERKVPGHINYQELLEKAPGIAAKRMVLTHLGEDMLAKKDGLEHECLEEGKILRI